MPGLGIQSFIQYAPESSYCVGGVTATKRLEVISMNIDAVYGYMPDPNLTGFASRKGLYIATKYFKGTITFRLNYENVEELLRSFMGTYTGTLVGGQSAVWDHVFKELSPSTGPLRTYRIQMVEGNVPTGQCQILIGAKVIEAVIKGANGNGADGMLTCTLTVVARDKLPGQVLTGAPSQPFTLPVLFNQAYVLMDGVDNVLPGFATFTGTCSAATAQITAISPSTTALLLNPQSGVYPLLVNIAGAPSNPYTLMSVDSTTQITVSAATGVTGTGITCSIGTNQRVKSFELTLSNPHHEDRFYLGPLVDEPLRSDFLSAKWRLVEEFQSIDAFNQATTYATVTPSLILRHPTAIGTGTVNRELEMHSNSAQIIAYSPPVQNYGIIMATCEMEAVRNATDASALYIRNRNTVNPTTLP